MALLALPDLYGRRHLDSATWAGQTRLQLTSFARILSFFPPFSKWSGVTVEPLSENCAGRFSSFEKKKTFLLLIAVIINTCFSGIAGIPQLSFPPPYLFLCLWQLSTVPFPLF
jgi:hypothetical protein